MSQGEARCDPLIAAEQISNHVRAIAFLTAMQQDDVIRQVVGAIE